MKIENEEKKILEALYDRINDSNNVVSTYDAPKEPLSEILAEAGMNERSARNALQNLADFDFIRSEQNSIKILPSGIKYCLKEFEHHQA